MNIPGIIIASIGLAMDAFAVSICKGLSIRKIKLKDALKIGVIFGIFQGGLPAVGYLLGMKFEALITNIDHWVAFVLLFFIGGKMIYEVIKGSEEHDDDLSLKTIVILAIATSIDALAFGIAYVFAYQSTNAILCFISIGIITSILSFIGVYIGNRFGRKFEKIAKLIGGSILIILGIKILVEHLGIL